MEPLTELKSPPTYTRSPATASARTVLFAEPFQPGTRTPVTVSTIASRLAAVSFTFVKLPPSRIPAEVTATAYTLPLLTFGAQPSTVPAAVMCAAPWRGLPSARLKSPTTYQPPAPSGTAARTMPLMTFWPAAPEPSPEVTDTPYPVVGPT